MNIPTSLLLLSLIASSGACMSPTPAAGPLEPRSRDAQPPCPEARVALPSEVPPPGSYDSGPGPKIGVQAPPVFVPPAGCMPDAPEAGAR
jgi:hypothetical protein